MQTHTPDRCSALFGDWRPFKRDSKYDRDCCECGAPIPQNDRRGFARVKPGSVTFLQRYGIREYLCGACAGRKGVTSA